MTRFTISFFLTAVLIPVALSGQAYDSTYYVKNLKYVDTKGLNRQTILQTVYLLQKSPKQDRQLFQVYNGDTINRTDSTGMWTGHCMRFYFHTIQKSKRYFNGSDSVDLTYSTNSDTTIQEGNFVNGKMDGVWNTWYPDGKLKVSLTYKDGYVNGPVKTFFPDGCPWVDGYFENGRWKYQHIEYFSDQCGKAMCVQNFGKVGKGYTNTYSLFAPSGSGDGPFKGYSSKQLVCCGCDSVKTDSSTQIFHNSRIANEIVIMKNSWIKTYFFPIGDYPFYWQTENKGRDTLTSYSTDSVYTIQIYYDRTLRKGAVKEGAKFRRGKASTFYPNGKVRSIIHSKTHSYNWSFYNHGPYAEYYSNGNKKVSGEYRVKYVINPNYPRMRMTPKYWLSSMPKGKWVYFYETGQMGAKYFFFCGVRIYKKFYDENGDRSKRISEKIESSKQIRAKF